VGDYTVQREKATRDFYDLSFMNRRGRW